VPTSKGKGKGKEKGMGRKREGKGARMGEGEIGWGKGTPQSLFYKLDTGKDLHRVGQCHQS